MWDDEDNNPYGSFHRRDSDEIQSPTDRFNRPSTPPSGHSSPTQAHFVTRPSDLSDEALDDDRPTQSTKIQAKEGGYDSRIEQILYENPDLEIQIVHAGKNSEGGGGYITYTIVTGDIQVRRRYSEFASLRQTLVNLHPTLIIPPIPEKHSIADYAAKPTKAKEDQGIIELRQRMLATFLNRCRRMKQVREDGVWWRFLDPNVSWSEVLHSHPAASVPKNNLKAPPLDPANPTQAHSYLPVPATNAKLRSTSSSNTTAGSGTPITSPAALSTSSTLASAAAHTTPQIQYTRFPPTSQDLSESELDPYFSTFESQTASLESLLTGPLEKTNARLLRHLYALGDDLMDLGARYNAFSLSESSSTLAHAIEKVGQACDFMYIQVRDMGSAVGAGFAEPMRESAQFAGVVRGVLRYRVLKRVQEEMCREELEKSRMRLEQLERSESEARRIEQYMTTSGVYGQAGTPKRSNSTSKSSAMGSMQQDGSVDDNASVDSDFPSSTTATSTPSAQQGPPQNDNQQPPSSPSQHKRATSSGLTSKLFGKIQYAIQGATDQDPERARRDALGKTKESLGQLEQAIEVAGKDVRDASKGVLEDLRRFQGMKEADLRGDMLNFARSHIEWSKRSLEEWEKAKGEVGKIEVR